MMHWEPMDTYIKHSITVIYAPKFKHNYAAFKEYKKKLRNYTFLGFNMALTRFSSTRA